MEERRNYIKERSDKYFIENLHLMFNRPNLLFKNRKDGNPMVDAFVLKNDEDKMEIEKKEIEFILNRLRQMFHSIANINREGSFYGGGASLIQLKNKIREKVKNIKPRSLH